MRICKTCEFARHVNLHARLLHVLQSDKALPLFDKAAERFKEVTCTGLLNWGNVHVCKAHKYLDEAVTSGRVS
jgi:hypothetical protein